MFNRSLDMEWRGQKFSVLVTMDLLEEVDEKFNLVHTVAKMTMGDVKFIRLSRFLAFINMKAGGDISAETFYTDMFGKDESLVADALVLANKILAAFFPDVDDGEKKSN